MSRCIAAILSFVILSGVVALAQDVAAPTSQPQTSIMRSMGSKFDLMDKTDSMIAQYDKDPLGRIAGQMGAATDLLAEMNTNSPTQPKQQEIVAGLDELIAMLEKQKKNAKTGNGLNPNNPMPDSSLTKGHGISEDLHDSTASARLWGQLSAKERQQILQSQNDGFPAGYETILSSYYKRLAQENVDGPADATATAAPTTQP